MKNKRIPPPALPLKGEDEKKFYSQISKYLIAGKSWNDVDFYLVSLLAFRWGLYRYAAMQLEKPDNAIQKFESGATNVSAWYSVFDKEAAYILKLAVQLGIGQKGREAILAFKADANESGGIMSKLQAIRQKSKKRV